MAGAQHPILHASGTTIFQLLAGTYQSIEIIGHERAMVNHSLNSHHTMTAYKPFYEIE